MSHCRLALFSSWIGLVGACAPVAAVAPKPTIAAAAKEKIRGTVLVDVDDVPEDAICSYVEGGEELCVSGFRSAYADGVAQVMNAFVEPGSVRYRALFRIIEFVQLAENVNVLGRDVRALLLLRWQFALSDNRGNKVVYVERTTRAPRFLQDPGDLEPVIGELVEASLNELVLALDDTGIHVPNAQRVFTAPPAKPAPQAPPGPSREPGAP